MTPDPGPVFHKFLTPDPVPKKKCRILPESTTALRIGCHLCCTLVWAAQQSRLAGCTKRRAAQQSGLAGCTKGQAAQQSGRRAAQKSGRRAAKVAGVTFTDSDSAPVPKFLIRKFFKFENPTPVQTPATIIDPTVIYPCFYLRNDHTDSCYCRN